MKKESLPDRPPGMPHRWEVLFRRLAETTAHRMGSPLAFLLALLLIVAWALSGFFLGFDQRWQLIINTGTTIATFLIVILVQNTQYRESRSIQLKLDELLLRQQSNGDFFMEVEEESDEELELLKEKFKELRKKYIARLESRAHARHKSPKSEPGP